MLHLLHSSIVCVCFIPPGQNQNHVSSSSPGQNQNLLNPRSPFLLKMAQQSVFSHGRRSSNCSTYVCKCGLDAPVMSPWTNVNPSRRFYKYGMYTICISFSIDVYKFKVNAMNIVRYLFMFIFIDAYKFDRDLVCL